MTQRPILAIYLEPAPYIIGLIKELRQAWSAPIDVLFASRNITQAWGVDVCNQRAELLPAPPIAAFGEIWRRLASGRYGLVHLGGWGHPVLLAAIMIAAWFGIPVAVESDTQAYPVLSFGSRCRAWAKRIMYPMLFSLPTVFLPGGTRQSMYLRSYGVPTSRIHIAQMTADIEVICAYCAQITTEKKRESLRRLGIEEEPVRFLYVGRLEPYKGVLDVLEAFEKLAKDRQDVSLLIVGDGSLRKAVELAHMRNSSIYYFGWMGGEDLFEVYGLADVFVLASHLDAWGLVVNEAMAAGLPIIAADRVGCTDDLVRPSENGLIVPFDEPDALRDAMAKLADSPVERNRMGDKSAQIIKGWTLDNQSRRTVVGWKAAGA